MKIYFYLIRVYQNSISVDDCSCLIIVVSTWSSLVLEWYQLHDYVVIASNILWFTDCQKKGRFYKLSVCKLTNCKSWLVVMCIF